MKLDRRGFLFSLPAAVVAAKARAVAETPVEFWGDSLVETVGIPLQEMEIERAHAHWVRHRFAFLDAYRPDGPMDRSPFTEPL